MIVLKFGGSSLATADRVRAVAERIAARTEPLAVVVSALGDTTDQLLQTLDAAQRKDRLRVAGTVDALAARASAAATSPQTLAGIDGDITALRELLLGISLLGEVSPATRDLILSFGERLAARVVADALEQSGRTSVVIDARSWLITDERFGEARVDEIASRRNLEILLPRFREAIPVVTGFIGRTPDGRTTTLGRGGSDYTAALLAAQLDAEALEIWTDVAGVYSADPALVPDAFPLRAMTYGEALELAAFGARVLHPRTLVPLMESGIPMTVRSTLDPDGPLTRIDSRGADDATRATSVTSLSDLALIDLEFLRLHASPGATERVQRVLEETQTKVWITTYSNHGQAMSMVVPQAQADRAVRRIEQALERELVRGDLAPVRIRRSVAMITLVAEAMGQTSNVAGRLFAALGRVGVNVYSIGQSATQRSISVVLDDADLAVAVRTVHASFHFAVERVSLLLLGAGTVGGALLRQIGAQAPILRRDLEISLDLVGVATSDRLAFDEEGLDPASWRASAVEDAKVDASILDRLARMPTPILIDCTAAEGMQDLYLRAFRRGIHVVAANKKPLTIPLPARQDVLDSARRAHRVWRYETTVGAALPVVSTLHDLVRTGDVVHRVQGAFSGTLGFLCDQLTCGVPLDQAVREAMTRGYTEPRPQEDLAGTDAARKALILAREIGLPLALEDVAIEPLVDAELLEIEGVEAFLEALTVRRGAMEARIEALRSAGQRLRYLAVIDPTQQPALKVGPIGVDADHPAWGLRGSQAFVAFTTARYPDQPLVVQGAGAGGDVTASGVLADVIRVAEGVRG
ncbi:MAG: bifunctional aspartate kinase/homoserine dehydrogenase I [Deltaproteobacteria bacterium]|nr:MAG: bifunctional aspartate kinase/homoserine dehydrogenase I [Deltaproteobacteria bacterium]